MDGFIYGCIWQGVTEFKESLKQSRLYFRYLFPGLCIADIYSEDCIFQISVPRIVFFRYLFPGLFISGNYSQDCVFQISIPMIVYFRYLFPLSCFKDLMCASNSSTALSPVPVTDGNRTPSLISKWPIRIRSLSRMTHTHCVYILWVYNNCFCRLMTWKVNSTRKIWS